jgi:Peptidase family C25/Propeptide_C25
MLLTALLPILATGPASAATKPPSAQAAAKQRLAQLVSDTRALPRSAVKRADKAALLRNAVAARGARASNPCRSKRLLGAYRGLLPAIQNERQRDPAPTGGSPRGQVEADALGAHAALLALPRARRCGGIGKANVGETKVRLLQSDKRRVRMRISFPTPTFSAHQVGSSDYQQMFMEGMGETGEKGRPGLPILTNFLAVPTGARLKLRVDRSAGYTLKDVKLFPHQPEPVDGTPPDRPDESLFRNEPFVKSSRAYKSRSPFPSKLSHAALLGNMRELRIGGVDVVGGQYRPRLRNLRVLTSIDVTVRFRGGEGTFADGRRVNSPWEAYWLRNYESSVLNWGAAADFLDLDDLEPTFCGEDLLVVTTPALQPAANTFANARQAAGYATKVALVGPDPGQIGTTREAIQAYILGELNAACQLRPTYVVLFGDTSHVPTWLVPCSDGGDVAECDLASDLPYSLNAPADIYADVELGRIPAHDLDAANAVVNKIVGYETTPPANPDFYRHSTVTAYFETKSVCVLNVGQSGEPNCKSENGPVTGHYELDYTNHKDTRGFTRTAEKIQNAMANVGFTADRVYTTLPEVSPETYYNNEPIPDYLRKPTFAWNGTGADLLGHYNDGRNLILHRDHGWHSGWSHPTLHSGDVPSMVNGTELPVVFGVDCLSAQFDIPGVPSFVEQQVMKPDGGAFAGFGDTRVSPTWANNNIAFGFFDAMFPDVSTAFGAKDGTGRLGKILQSGKFFMATKNGVGYQSAAATYKEHYIYHLLGDPSAQVWANLPVQIDVEEIDVDRIPVTGPGPPFRVLVNMRGQAAPRGAVVTLFQRGTPIGRAVVGAGAVEITPEVAEGTDDLTVAIEQDGSPPAQKAVESGPSEPLATTSTVRCPSDTRMNQATTFGGHLDPGFAGAQVKLTYTRTSSGTPMSFERTATTDAGGDWTDTVTFTRPQIGRWRVTAGFDGDSSHKPSSAQCEVDVTA